MRSVENQFEWEIPMTIEYRFLKKPGLTGAFMSTGVLLILALFAITGCDNNPIQSELQADITTLSAAGKVAGQDSDFDCYEASGLITVSDGGIIQLGWGSPRNSLRFDPGSVTEDAVIDVTTCIVKGNPQNNFSVIELEFSPDGLFFSPPAQIVINAGSLNALRAPKYDGVVRLYYYDPETDEWLLQQEAIIKKGKVTFEIDHFSKFGISH